MTDLLLLPLAQQDLDDIEGFSFNRFGEQAAPDYMSAIERALDRLSGYPESGPVYPGIRPQIRFTRAGQHYLFYDYDGKAVSVVRVLHHARVPEDLL